MSSLQEIPAFSDLNDHLLAQAAEHAQIWRCGPRAPLFEAGQRYSGLHVVRAGQIAMSRRRADREQILGVLGPGEMLDIAPLLDGGPHAWTAQPLGKASGLWFPPAAIHALLEASPAFRLKLLNIVSIRLRELAGIVSDLAFKDVGARLAGVLVQCAEQDGTIEKSGVHIQRKLTARELAARSGTAREVVQRYLRRFTEERMIQRSGTKIVILNLEALRCWAEGEKGAGEQNSKVTG